MRAPVLDPTGGGGWKRTQPVTRDSHCGLTNPGISRDLANRPPNNLGSIAIERQDWAQALDLLDRSRALSAPNDSITRKLYALIARAHQMFGDTEAALRTCARGLHLDPEDAELWFRKAIVHRHRGEPGDAENSWRRILTLSRPEQFAGLDMGIYGHLTRRNLAAVALERGDAVEAARQWRAVLAECPGDREATARRDRLRGARRLLESRLQPESGAGATHTSRACPHGPPEGGTPTAEPAAGFGPPLWIVPGSTRRTVPQRGPGDFDPYAPLAAAWEMALRAQVVVELGVRFGDSTRALLAGVAQTGGDVWGVDRNDIHGINDPRFHFVHPDAAAVADRWPAIDLLHIDTDPHTEEQTRRWFALYADRCRAIALHDAHHPAFGGGAAGRAFVASGGWDVSEFWGNPSGWTVLTRPGEPSPEEAGPPGPFTARRSRNQATLTLGCVSGKREGLA